MEKAQERGIFEMVSIPEKVKAPRICLASTSIMKSLEQQLFRLVSYLKRLQVEMKSSYSLRLLTRLLYYLFTFR